MMNKHAIVHITDVIFYPESFLYNSVKAVKIVNGKPLTGLISHRKAFSRKSLIAVYNILQKYQQPFICNNFSKFSFQNVMVNRIKILSDITAKKISIVSIGAVIVSKKSCQSFKCKGKSFTDSARNIIIYQSFIQFRSQNIIAQTVLYYAVNVMKGINISGSVNILMGLFKKTDNTQKNKEGSLVK